MPGKRALRASLRTSLYAIVAGMIDGDPPLAKDTNHRLAFTLDADAARGMRQDLTRTQPRARGPQRDPGSTIGSVGAEVGAFAQVARVAASTRSARSHRAATRVLQTAGRTWWRERRSQRGPVQSSISADSRKEFSNPAGLMISIIRAGNPLTFHVACSSPRGLVMYPPGPGRDQGVGVRRDDRADRGADDTDALRPPPPAGTDGHASLVPRADRPAALPRQPRASRAHAGVGPGGVQFDPSGEASREGACCGTAQSVHRLRTHWRRCDEKSVAGTPRVPATGQADFCVTPDWQVAAQVVTHGRVQNRSTVRSRLVR